MAALNKVRLEVGIQAIDIDDLILSTLGRVEDKLNEEAKAGPETSNEQVNEEINEEASEKKEVDLTH